MSRRRTESRRTACLLVPDLPLAAARRAHPELAEQPVAIASGPGPRAEILAVSDEAARCGARPFTTVVQARAACAALQIRVASPGLERAARQALLDVAASASPRVEAAPPVAGLYAAEAAVFLDASGTGSLFRSEAGLATALAARAARLGLPARVAIASTRTTARLAARTLVRESMSESLPAESELPKGAGPDTAEDQAPREKAMRPKGASPAEAAAEERVQAPLGRAQRAVGERSPEVRLVPAGGDAAFLAPLPVDLLDPDPETTETLARFGIHRLGELTRLPRAALLTRLGAGARALLDLARGVERTPLPAVPRETRCEEAIDLEVALDRLEPLAFVLRGMLSRLGERLACRGLVCGDLDLRLDLEGGERDARRVGVAAPTSDVRILLRLVSLSLESHPPAAAVESVSLTAEARAPRSDQLDLFRPAGPAPALLARTLAELEALCGPGRVGAPVVADSHRPDAWALASFAPASPEPPPRDGPSPGQMAVRALRPPVPAEVRLVAGRPAFVRSAVANGSVADAAGPWRTTGAWWSEEERFAFDHFDVWTRDGTLCRLRLDRIRRRWEIDAIYD